MAKAYDFDCGFDRANGAGAKPLKESSKAYSAFVAYCELGRTRTLAQTALVLGTTTNAVHSHSRRYDWEARCAHYDADQIKARFSDVRQEQEEQHRHAIRTFRNDQERRAKSLGILGDLMLDVATEKIESMRAAGEQISEQSLSNIAKTVASLHEMSMNLGATALGIDELESALDAELDKR